MVIQQIFLIFKMIIESKGVKSAFLREALKKKKKKVWIFSTPPRPPPLPLPQNDNTDDQNAYNNGHLTTP